MKIQRLLSTENFILFQDLNNLLLKFHKRVLLALFFILKATQAFGARPMMTDDARIVDSKACQLEAWVKNTKEANEYWAYPACNIGTNAEVTIGGAYETIDGTTSFANETYQIKSLIQRLEESPLAYGVTLGNGRDPKRTNKKVIQDWYLNVPISYQYSDLLVLHTNLGVTQLTDEKRQQVNWGFSTEYKYSNKIELITEVFNQSTSYAYFQLGLRYWIEKDRIQIDTTYGNRFRDLDENQNISIGLRLISLPFLP